MRGRLLRPRVWPCRLLGSSCRDGSLWHRVAPPTVLRWYNGFRAAAGGWRVGAAFPSSGWRTAPPHNRESGSMTVDALAGAHAGTATRETDVSGDDTYETARTFESLGVSPELTGALADEGIVSAFPIQALTIADALAGRDVCGKAKTGSGKTLAFGVPLLQRAKATREAQGQRPAPRPAKPLALVLLPTRELAVQVHDVLAPLAKKLGVHAVGGSGGADIDRQVAKLRKGVDLVIATPGRLIDLGDRGEIAVDELETLVLDEGDCRCEMALRPRGRG